MSEENKLTTNHIEKVLLEKKQKEFANELKDAVNKLDTVLYKYVGSMKSDDLKEFVSWFAKNVMTLRAPMGSRSMICTNLHPDYYPKAINDIFLKMAVDEFLKSVEDTKTQLEEVYSEIEH